MEGGPPRAIPIGHIPNEVRIAMQPGPGKITMAEPPPARPHALLALAREMGAADKLTTLVAEVRRAKEAAEASAEVSRKEGRTTVLAEAEAAAHPQTAEEQQAQRAADATQAALLTVLDGLAEDYLPLLRAVRVQLKAFEMLLLDDWRAEARGAAEAQLRAREAEQRAKQRFAAQVRQRMVAVTLAASMGGDNAEMAAHEAAHRGRELRHAEAALERAEARRAAAKEEVRRAVDEETRHLQSLLVPGSVLGMYAGGVLPSITLQVLGGPGSTAVSSTKLSVAVEPRSGDPTHDSNTLVLSDGEHFITAHLDARSIPSTAAVRSRWTATPSSACAAGR